MSLAQTPSKGLAHSAVCRGPLCSPPVTSPTLASAAPGAAAPARRPGLAQRADTLLPGALGARPLRPHVFSQMSPSCAQHPHCPAPSLTPSTYHHVYCPPPPAEADLRVGEGPVCLVSVGAWNGARSRAGARVFVRRTERASDVCRQLASPWGLRGTRSAATSSPPSPLPGAPSAPRIGGRAETGTKGRRRPRPRWPRAALPVGHRAGSHWFPRSHTLSGDLLRPGGSLDHEVEATPGSHKPTDWEST